MTSSVCRSSRRDQVPVVVGTAVLADHPRQGRPQPCSCAIASRLRNTIARSASRSCLRQGRGRAIAELLDQERHRMPARERDAIVQNLRAEQHRQVDARLRRRVARSTARASPGTCARSGCRRRRPRRSPPGPRRTGGDVPHRPTRPVALRPPRAPHRPCRAPSARACRASQYAGIGAARLVGQLPGEDRRVLRVRRAGDAVLARDQRADQRVLRASARGSDQNASLGSCSSGATARTTAARTAVVVPVVREHEQQAYAPPLPPRPAVDRAQPALARESSRRRRASARDGRRRP